MSDKIINPLTGRSILVDGPTHRALLERGIYLPDEIVEYIALQTSPPKILNYCLSNQRLMEKCYTKYFWLRYLQHDQQRLHELLISLSEQGSTKLFEFIWNLDISLIKERRTLKMAHELFYKGGYKGFARRLWNIEKQWFEDYFRYIVSGGIHTDIVIYIELLYDLQSTASQGKEEEYRELYKKIKLLFFRYGNIEVLTNYLLFKSGAKAIDIDFVGFIIELDKHREGVISDRSSNERQNVERVSNSNNSWMLHRIAAVALQEGRFEFVMEMYTEGLLDKEMVQWHNLLESSREDSIERLREIYGRDFILVSGRFDYLTRLGNEKILRDYMNTFHTDEYILMNSYETLSAENFIKLLLSIKKCMKKDSIDYFISDLEVTGDDYLVSLIRSSIPIC